MAEGPLTEGNFRECSPDSVTKHTARYVLLPGGGTASSREALFGGQTMGERGEGRASGGLVVACWAVRLALATSFLSAVADRFGLWGPPGAPGVAWGSVPKYEEYVATLNWFLPAGLVPVAGWAATVCEVLLALGLLVGWRLFGFAVATGLLLTTFGVAMLFALGPKPPLDYSVPTAAAAAFLLAAVSRQKPPRRLPASLQS